MRSIVLGIDQGTSSTRCLALDEQQRRVGAGSAPVTCSTPAPGLVEQDPERLFESACAAVTAALREAGADHRDVAAVGIANQTETFVICDREHDRPIHPAIVWQDRRTARHCEELAAAGHGATIHARTGLELDPAFPATKIGWVLDQVSGARQRASTGELVYHDVAGWLVRRFTGVELCDIGNAGRSLLCELGAGTWSDDLAELFDVPRRLLPPIVDSDAIDAIGADGTPLAGAPISVALGDQQASLFGLGCHRPGQTKVTLGTGAFVLAQAGADAEVPPPGVLGSCAWRLGGDLSFALEGFVPAAGSAVDWFASIGMIPPAGELDRLLAESGPEQPSIACVPALQGFGTPRWEPDVQAGLLGLTRATTRAELARAVIDGVLHQVADALEAIAVRMAPSTVMLDGGLARSDWVMQRLADLASIEVRRPANTDATVFGVALAAGIRAGRFSAGDRAGTDVDRVAEPRLDPALRAELRASWRAAADTVTDWR